MTDHRLAPPLHPDSLRDQLQRSLGAAYTIERELGGGGMSRVFVAREVALGRRVVVKVLPPDLAGMNVERFRREIQLAAALQHPHIVPVHSAGETAPGVPYYTMPFIEGETLRSRLTRAAGPLPVAEAVRVLRDVASALAHAHERGVVHRDVKPDNVLLTGGHAVVTDFGVAKALAEANPDLVRRGTPGGNMDTAAGIAVGTPTYMAPEQAAGDPATDHRADIYATGVLAYELLTGRPPFVKRAPHEVLMAHLAEAPAPLESLRPDLAPALADLVMRCLAKSPDDRPQTAAELRDGFDGVSDAGIATPGGRASAAPVRRWHRAAVAAGAIALVAVAGVLTWRARPLPPAPDDNIVAVAPFRVAAADPSLRYLREGMLDLLAAKLTGEGGPRSADPRALLSAWRRAAGSDTADLPRERALVLAERIGAGKLLLGEVLSSPDAARRITLRASLISVRDGRADLPQSVEGSVDSLPQLVDRLTMQLLATSAGETSRLAALTSTSLPALRAYLGGQWMYRHARYAESAREFERALQHDSTFALAALGLSVASGWAGDPAARYRGMKLATLYRDRLSERDRALLDATAGPRFPAAPTPAELLAAKVRYATLAPERPEAWFEKGDGLFHFGALVGQDDAMQQAAIAFRRAIALDSTFAPALEHLLLVEARLGDSAAVRRLGQLYLAIDPGSDNADGVRWRVALAAGDTAAASAIARRQSELSHVSAHTIQMVSQLEGLALGDADQAMRATLADRSLSKDQHTFSVMLAHDLALNRGQPSRALALSAEHERAIRGTGSTLPLRERVRDAIYWDGDSAAAATAARQLAERASDTMPSAPAARAQYHADLCVLELWRLAHNDRSSTRTSMQRLRAAMPAAPTPVTTPSPAAPPQGTGPQVSCALLLDASLAVAERRPDALPRVARLDSALRSGAPGGVGELANLATARLFEELGDVPAALAAVRRREYFLSRTAYLSTYLREEGRLAALTGDRDGAIDAYRQYLALRRDAEPALRGDLENVREEIERLQRGDLVP